MSDYTVVAKLAAELGADIRGWVSGLDDAFAAYKKFEGQIMGAGLGLTAAVSVPLAGLAGGAIKEFAGFEAQMKKVAAVGGNELAPSLERLQGIALEFATKTKYGATDTADAMGQLATAGFKAGEIISALPGVLNLAASDSMKLGDAALVASDIMHGFGMTAKDITHIVDVMAKAGADSSANITQLAISMRYAAPYAQLAGQSIEDTAAALMVLADNGIRGSKAGTALRQFFNDIIGPTKKAQEALDGLGIKVRDASGNLLPMAELLKNMQPLLQNAAAGQAIWGQRWGEVSFLIKNANTAFKTAQESMKNVQGEGQRMADTMNTGVSASLTKLTNNLEVAAIKIGESLAPSFTGLLEKVTSVVKAFNDDLTPGTQKLVLEMLGIGIAIGPAMIAFSALTSGIGIAVDAIRAFSFAGTVQSMITFATTTTGSVIPALAGIQLGAMGAAASIAILTAGITAALYAIYRIVDAWWEAEKAQAAAERANKESRQGMEKAAEAARQLGVNTKALDIAFKNGAISETEYNQTIRAAIVEQVKLKGTLKDTEKQKQGNREATDALDETTRKLKSTIEGATGALDSNSKASKKQQAEMDAQRRAAAAFETQLSRINAIRSRMGDGSMEQFSANFGDPQDILKALRAIESVSESGSASLEKYKYGAKYIETLRKEANLAADDLRKMSAALGYSGEATTESLQKAAVFARDLKDIFSIEPRDYFRLPKLDETTSGLVSLKNLAERAQGAFNKLKEEGRLTGAQMAKALDDLNIAKRSAELGFGVKDLERSMKELGLSADGLREAFARTKGERPLAELSADAQRLIVQLEKAGPAMESFLTQAQRRKANIDLAILLGLTESNLKDTLGRLGVTLDAELTERLMKGKLSFAELAKQGAADLEVLTRLAEKAGGALDEKLFTAVQAQRVREYEAKVGQSFESVQRDFSRLGIAFDDYEVRIKNGGNGWRKYADDVAASFERQKGSFDSAAEYMIGKQAILYANLEAQANMSRTKIEAAFTGLGISIDDRMALDGLSNLQIAANKAAEDYAKLTSTIGLSAEQSFTAYMALLEKRLAADEQYFSQLSLEYNGLPAIVNASLSMVETRFNLAALRSAKAFQDAFNKDVKDLVDNLFTFDTDKIVGSIKKLANDSVAALKDLMIAPFRDAVSGLVTDLSKQISGFISRTLVGNLFPAFSKTAETAAITTKAVANVANTSTEAASAMTQAASSFQQSAGVIAKATQGISSATASAGSSLTKFMGIITAVSSAITAVTSVLQYLQGRRMEQDIGRIEVTTRGQLNELLNARADEWSRWAKTETLWATLFETLNRYGDANGSYLSEILGTLQRGTMVAPAGLTAGGTYQDTGGGYVPVVTTSQNKFLTDFANRFNGALEAMSNALRKSGNDATNAATTAAQQYTDSSNYLSETLGNTTTVNTEALDQAAEDVAQNQATVTTSLLEAAKAIKEAANSIFDAAEMLKEVSIRLRDGFQGVAKTVEDGAAAVTDAAMKAKGSFNPFKEVIPYWMQEARDAASKMSPFGNNTTPGPLDPKQILSQDPSKQAEQLAKDGLQLQDFNGNPLGLVVNTINSTYSVLEQSQRLTKAVAEKLGITIEEATKRINEAMATSGKTYQKAAADLAGITENGPTMVARAFTTSSKTMASGINTAITPALGSLTTQGLRTAGTIVNTTALVSGAIQQAGVQFTQVLGNVAESAWERTNKVAGSFGGSFGPGQFAPISLQQASMDELKSYLQALQSNPSSLGYTFTRDIQDMVAAISKELQSRMGSVAGGMAVSGPVGDTYDVPNRTSQNMTLNVNVNNANAKETANAMIQTWRSAGVRI